MGGGGQPIDSTRTDARGAYALTIRRPDSATIYVVSTWYAGIAYFSEPITPGRSSSSLRPLSVYDTSSTGPPVRVTRDRKSTRLNSSHSQISYAVFCLKKNSQRL